MRRFPRLAGLLPVAVVIALVGALPGVGVGRASAQQSDKQHQLQQQLDDMSAAEQTAMNRLAQAQASRHQLDAALAGITDRLAAANERLAAAQAESARLAALAAALATTAADTGRQLAQAKHDVRHSALVLYTHSDSGRMLGLLNSTNGSGAFVEGQHYLQRLSDLRRRDAERVTKLKAQLAAQQAQVAAQQQAADDARAAAASAQAAISGIAAQQAQARAAATSAAQQESAMVADLRAQQDQLEADLQAESDRIAQLARDAGGGPALGNGRFVLPVPGPVTSPFGYRSDPITGATKFHAGVDLGSACGTPIKAAGTGVVIQAGFDSGGYGNMTLINHGGGLSTLYGHQSSIIVAAGQSVTQGQVIGYVGSTGKSTGCHLHWEVRVDGTPVDPMGYV